MSMRPRTQRAVIGVGLGIAALAGWVYLSKKMAQAKAMGATVTIDPDIAADMIAFAGALTPGKAALVRLATRKLAQRAAPAMGFTIGRL
jgi:hypothetical protein